MAAQLQELLRIRELIRRANYQDALDALECIQANGLSEVDQAWHGALTAEALIWLGKDVGDRAEIASDFFRNTADHEGYATARYVRAWQLHRGGELMEAKEAALEAYASCKRAGYVAGLGRSSNLLFMICYHLGQFENAIEYQKKSIKYYQDIGDDKTVAVLKFSVAMVHLRRGEVRTCLEVTESAREFRNLLEPINRINLEFRFAMAYAHLGNFKKSATHFAYIKKHVSPYKREEAIYYEYLGWAKILEKDFKAAEAALKTGLELSFKMGNSTTLISQTKRLLADVYVATKRYKLAEQTALESLQVAEKIGERLEIAASWRVLAQTAAHLGTKEEAVEYFRKSIDLFSQIGFRFELAYTRYLAARSRFYSTEETSTLLHMAGEYFASEELTEYTKLIDESSAGLPKSSAAKPKPINGNVPVAVIHQSRKLKKVMALVEKAAPTNFTVLLTGAPGTGKDVIARYIHEHSGRDGSFISFNAAAVQPTLAESVLFGTIKGVFTDATDRPGLFEAAANGTFFLNEIGNASLELQAKLLDVLETRSFCRVGETTPRTVDFRLVAATNANLEEMIRAGTFRADLFHRIRQIPVHIPSLDERKEDIAPLIAHFLSERNEKLSDSDLERLAGVLAQRTWPGNVRELKSELDIIWMGGAGEMERVLREAERRIKLHQHKEAVAVADGNQSEAARQLGVDESTVRYWTT